MIQTLANSQQWRECLEYMARRTKEQSFNTWLKHTKGEPSGNGDFKVAVPNQFVADWISSHFRDLMDEAFQEVLGKKQNVVYIITGQNEDDDQTSLNFEQPYPSRPVGSREHMNNNLNSRYRFSTMVVGDFNQFACAASMAVAEAPGMTKYNPLYIYGGTGLGKTHLCHAMGNEIADAFPGKRVMYATSEKFTSDFISAISDRSVADFTRVYRDVDVLIIDDIQFFTGKESTQEQFFHTFNVLYHSGKQIILTSDRPPREIKGLEDRLLSRFQWGLVTDLQAPDLENRQAILYKKLSTEGTSIPDDVVRLIADQIKSNIRELEGALTRLLAYSSLKKVPVDVDIAKKVLSDTMHSSRKEVTIEAIIKKTCEHFNIATPLIRAKKKTADVALARQVAMYLSRTLTDGTLKAIGSAFGGRDHSTVIHACDLISKRMCTDSNLREKIDKVSASLLY